MNIKTHSFIQNSVIGLFGGQMDFFTTMRVFIMSGFCAFLLSPAWSTTLYSVTEIGNNTELSDINNTGHIIGMTRGNNDRPFLWDPVSGMSVFTDTRLTYPSAINNKNEIAFWGWDKGYVWSPVTGLRLLNLPSIAETASYASLLQAINDSGQVAGSVIHFNYNNQEFDKAASVFWDTDGTFDLMGRPPVVGNGAGTFAQVNNAGLVLGLDDSGRFLWNSFTKKEQVMSWPIISGNPYKINDNGEILVNGTYTSIIYLILNSAGEIIRVSETPPNFEKDVYWVNDLNNRGEIVGTVCIKVNGNCQYEGVMWDSQNKLHNINDHIADSTQGWKIVYTKAINDNGQIAA